MIAIRQSLGHLLQVRPSLKERGVSRTLDDPTLELHDGNDARPRQLHRHRVREGWHYGRGSGRGLQRREVNVTDKCGVIAIVLVASQHLRQIEMEHLVEKEAHGRRRSSRNGRGNVGMFDSRAGVKKRGLNIFPRETRIAAEQVLPALASRHLFHEHLHRNARAANHRLPIANMRIEFDAVEELTHSEKVAYLGTKLLSQGPQR